MRGPQIAVTATGIHITAGNKAGNIFLYSKEMKGNWALNGCPQSIGERKISCHKTFRER